METMTSKKIETKAISTRTRKGDERKGPAGRKPLPDSQRRQLASVNVVPSTIKFFEQLADKLNALGHSQFSKSGLASEALEDAGIAYIARKYGVKYDPNTGEIISIRPGKLS